jgi:acetyl esterase/lipase
LGFSRLVLRLMPARPVPGVTVTTPASAPPLRVYQTAGAAATTGALLWMHGGGLVAGTVKGDERACGEIAREAGIAVVSVEYRLAPEHPFPAALEDCLAAWAWTREHAGDLGIDRERIAVGGQSAGGGLAAALAQCLHDAGEPPVAQLLFCPMLDDRTAANRRLDNAGHLIWHNRVNRSAWRHYLQREPGAPQPPYAVPARRADLSGLPPAWIGIGDIDLFYDESRLYAERLRAAGVDVDLQVVAGGPHGFELVIWDAELSRTQRRRARQWLAARLAAR